MALWRFIAWTGLFLLVCFGLVGSLASLIFPIFLANLGLNSLILGVWGAGIFWGLYTLIRIARGTHALLIWQDDPQGFLKRLKHDIPIPSLLKPFVQELRDRGAYGSHVQNSIQEKFQVLFQTRHASMRYMMGSLIFLGLLGTFWGLSLTIQGLSDVMTHFSVPEGGEVDFFLLLQTSLQKPLSGMGTAFGASLFGISASLILGFIDLQMNAAGTHFLVQLDFLLNHFRLFTKKNAPLASDTSTTSSFSEHYLEALWGHMAEHLEKFQHTIHTSETGRRHLYETLHTLSDKLSRLTDQMRTEQSLLLRLGEGQLENSVHLKTLVSELQTHPLQENLKRYVSDLDHLCTKMLHLLTEHQQQNMDELRQELRLLTKTLSRTLTTRPEPSTPPLLPL